MDSVELVKASKNVISDGWVTKERIKRLNSEAVEDQLREIKKIRREERKWSTVQV